MAIFEKRPSKSPFITSVWQASYDNSGEMTVTANGTWDIIFATYRGKTTCLITGPTNQAVSYRYLKGQRTLGISFTEGTYLRGIPAREIINTTRTISHANGFVVIKGTQFKVPDYAHVEEFVDELYDCKLLARDVVVEHVLQEGTLMNLPKRSVQRHFAETTGLPLNQHQQIARAQKAVTLIRQGLELRKVALECGYFDQSHMNRAIKRVLGNTPQQIKNDTEG